MILGLQPPVLGQTLDQTRPRVLRVLGTSAEENRDLFPLEAVTGVAYRLTVGHPNADSLQLFFRVLAEDSDPKSWSLRIVDPEQADRVYQEIDSDDVADTEIWSDEIPSSRVAVLLISDKPSNGIRIRLEELIVFKPQSAPLGITGGSNDMAPISGFEPWVMELGRSVARLIFSANDGQVYGCTGFMVTMDLLLTNYHCIATERNVRSALVDFDFDSEIADIERHKLTEIVHSNPELDYSIVRLRGTVARAPLPLAASAAVDSEELVIIQHPGAGPKMVSRVDCHVGRIDVPGESGELTDFSHLCDTLGSSSGSPVISLERHTIVGLHHLTFDENSFRKENKAVKIGQIVASLPADLRSSLLIGAEEDP